MWFPCCRAVVIEVDDLIDHAVEGIGVVELAVAQYYEGKFVLGLGRGRDGVPLKVAP